MTNRIVCLMLLVVVQGCVPQIVGEHIRKGVFVREESTGVASERKNKMIQLVSPLTVQVYEEVERGETTNKYYQKLLVQKQARAKEYPYFDLWAKVVLTTAIVPLFYPVFWIEGSFAGTDCLKEPDRCEVREEPQVMHGEYFTEKGLRLNVQRRLSVASSDRVSLYINGYYKGELPISSTGSATVDLLEFSELLSPVKAVKLTFKYFDSYAYSTLQKEDVGKIFEKAGPARPGGPENRMKEGAGAH